MSGPITSSSLEQLPSGGNGGRRGDYFLAFLAVLFALRRGVKFFLAGSLSLAELQHLHMVHGGGSATEVGSARA